MGININLGNVNINNININSALNDAGKTINAIKKEASGVVGKPQSVIGSNTRNEMFKKICAFIPGNINNETVISAFEAMRQEQKVKKKDFSGHKASNNANFVKHIKDIVKAGGYIEDQNAYTDVAYGESTMQYSGCEVFATYNAIHSLRKTAKISLPDMIAEYEKDGMVMGGKFGTSPKAIEDYLKRQGYTTEFCTEERFFDTVGERNQSLILTMYNNREDISKEVHTVMISKDKKDGKGDIEYKAHNVYCNGMVVGPAPSVSELIKLMNKGKAKGISLIGIKL